MEKLKNNIINGIFIIISFVFNITIFAPMEIYCTNTKELWFNLNDIVLIIIPLSIIILLFLIILLKLLKGKSQELYITIIFLINLGLYIQGNFLNIGYKPLDGEKVDWNSMIVKGIINTIIWIIILIVPLIYRKMRKIEEFKLVTTIISIFIILIQIITLITLLFTTNNNKNIVQGLNNSDIFNLSEEENIIVIMSDTFEGTYMNKLLEEYPEYKEKLKDFIYFDNCTGVSFFTYSSLPTLLTGVECQVGCSLDENLDYCFDNTNFYKVLKDNDYAVDLYTEKALVPNYEGIDNLNTDVKLSIATKTKIKLTKKMYKYVLYRYLPHFLKSNFELTSDEFNQIKTSDNVLTYKEKTYFIDDVEFNNVLLNDGITLEKSKKNFKFYHTDGMHIPYLTTPELEYNNTDEYLQKDDEEKRYNEALASINMLCNYIEELKKVNAYDQTTIIFLADHGYNNRFYTNLLVKKKYTNNEFKILTAPVSLKDDLIPTILNIATNSKDYGKDFFDYGENEKRTRQVFDYTYSTDIVILKENNYDFISKMVFQTEENAKNKDSFYVIDQEYNNQNKKLTYKYRFDKLIKISSIPKLNYINLVGFNLKKINLNIREGWNISKNTYIEVNRKESNSDVTLELAIKEINNEKQTINFKVNNQIIHSCLVTSNETIKFQIPKEIWNENEIFKLEMEFPDAVLGDNHATMMSAVRLDTIKFVN